jgi:hypothetical protein
MFGDTIIEDAGEDMGVVEAFMNAGSEVYAVIRLDEEGSGMYEFEVMRNDDGEGIISSDPIFATSQDAAGYLNGWVTDIQFD